MRRMSGYLASGCMKIMPQMQDSGTIAKLSVSLMPSLFPEGSIPRMSFFNVWSGQLAYPAAGLMILPDEAGILSASFLSSHVEAASVLRF